MWRMCAYNVKCLHAALKNALLLCLVLNLYTRFVVSISISGLASVHFELAQFIGHLIHFYRSTECVFCFGVNDSFIHVSHQSHQCFLHIAHALQHKLPKEGTHWNVQTFVKLNAPVVSSIKWKTQHYLASAAYAPLGLRLWHVPLISYASSMGPQNALILIHLTNESPAFCPTNANSSCATDQQHEDI